jgi:putative redox protein
MASEAKVTWIGPGLRLVGEASSGPAIVLDHVLPGEEGQETGPRPMELLLIGLAGCTAMDVVSILQKKRQPFTDLEVRVTAERAEEHPKVYTQIHLEFVVKGGGVDPRAVERAIELSQTKYCSAAAMLGKTAEITTSYRVVEG